MRSAAARIWNVAGTAAATTPPERDRVVDLLRAASLCIVVVGHAVMATTTWSGDTPHLGNVLAELRSLQTLTWVFQVMPLFFAAGGIANASSWANAAVRGVEWHTWMWGRARRLTRPVLYYLAIWVPLVAVLNATVGAGAAAALARLSTQLLWFLGIYLVVVATTPLQVAAAGRAAVALPAVAALIVGVDGARFHLVDGIGVLNFFAVWIGAATLGIVVRNHVHRRSALIGVATAATAVNVAVIHFGPYPWSMVGMPGETISNMAPPTVALALHATALICAVAAAWELLAAACQRPKLWHATCAAGGVAMTLYLWHLTALIGVTVVEHQLGLDRPAVNSGWFWPTTVVHVAVTLGAALAVTVVATPLEHLPVPWYETRHPRRQGSGPLAATGVIAAGIGLLALAATGMGGFPFAHTATYAGVTFTPGTALGLFLLGCLCIRGAQRPRR